MKSLLLVNSGGIVAVAAFVGASLGTDGPPWIAYVSGVCFAAGLLLPIWYQLQRMADAEAKRRTHPFSAGVRKPLTPHCPDDHVI